MPEFSGLIALPGRVALMNVHSPRRSASTVSTTDIMLTRELCCLLFQARIQANEFLQ